MTLKYYLVILVMLLWQTASAQGITWPVHYGYKPLERAPVEKGFIVSANGDTLKGSIKLLPNSGYYPILDSTSNRITKVNIPDIVLMRTYGYPAGWPYYNHSPRGPYVDYVHLPSTYDLWRVVGKKGHVEICDDVLRGGRNNYLILVTPKGLTDPKARLTLFKGGIWFLDDKIDLVLIRFINDRYKTGVGKGDFRATREIIDYILDKEDALR